MLEDTTILVKTFDRPKALGELLDSLEEHAPGCKVLVADDGVSPSFHVCAGSDNVLYLRLPTDVGLSAGRNFLVEQTQTPYCMILEDDFVIESSDTMSGMIEEVKRWPYDIVGGSLIMNNGQEQHYEGWMFQAGGTLFMMRIAGGKETIPVHIVLNFLAARTDALRAVKWDPELKIGEHEDYFWRAKKAGLRVGYSAVAQARHNRGSGDKKYRKFRSRTKELLPKSFAKNGWERVQWIIL